MEANGIVRFFIESLLTVFGLVSNKVQRSYALL